LGFLKYVFFSYLKLTSQELIAVTISPQDIGNQFFASKSIDSKSWLAMRSLDIHFFIHRNDDGSHLHFAMS
jgi:hypothetical protein